MFHMDMVYVRKHFHNPSQPVLLAPTQDDQQHWQDRTGHHLLSGTEKDTIRTKCIKYMTKTVQQWCSPKILTRGV